MAQDSDSTVYRFIADRLEDQQRQDYALDGQAAVTRYADALRSAQQRHHALLDACALGDEPAASEHRRALNELAQPWVGHSDYPLR